MALSKIEKQSAETLAADAVRAYILSGELSAGARLTEAFLAERFSLSRATVRGALQRVSQEGLVRLRPFTGWEIIGISSHDAWELYTMRASMESMAAQLASDRLDNAGEVQLSAAWDALLEACKSKDNRAVAQADWNLHRVVVDLSGHERLAQWYRVIQQQIALYITWSDFIPKNVYDAVPEHHRPIVQAILNRDGKTAARLSAEHNVAAGEKLVAHLRGLEQRAATSDTPGNP